MKNINKIIGVGMSKTGTTTLAACLEILGVGPHKSYDRRLKQWVQGGKIDKVLENADRYRSYEDAPWYLIYRELDTRYPGSKFILTVRKDSQSHAKSAWYHGVAAGTRKGEPDDDYIQQKIEIYEKHNAGVKEYFKDRLDDLLVLCWENGDGWQELCEFLGAENPGIPIPKANVGRYRNPAGLIKKILTKTGVYPLWLKLRYMFASNVLIQTLKRRLTGQD